MKPKSRLANAELYVFLISGLLVLIAVNADLTDGTNSEFAEKPVPKCVPVLIELCKDLPYNETRFPNLVNNDDQSEAELQLSTYAPLLHSHQNFAALKFFLCSV